MYREVAGSGLWLYWPHAEDTANILDDSALGPCNRDRYVAYVLKAPEFGPVFAGQGRNLGDPDIQAHMVDDFDAYEFLENTTYVMTAHSQTGELFVSSCASERCSEVEFYAAEQACLKKHLGECSYVAVHGQNETYCTIDPNG